jgi:hypothetical protein
LRKAPVRGSGLPHREVLGEMGGDLRVLVDVVEHLRLVLILGSGSTWVTGHGLFVNSHAPLSRLRPCDIICAEISHRLLDWVIGVSIIEVLAFTQHSP